jgi:hypothetical protein
MKICQGTKSKNTASSALLQKKGFLVYEAWMFLRRLEISTKHGYFSLRSMKRREGVFSPEAQKRYGTYKKFHASQRAELQIIYILDSKICTSNITVVGTCALQQEGQQG